MPKQKKGKENRSTDPESVLIPSSAAYLGGIVFVMGVVAMYYTSRSLQDTFTWHNYVAIAFTVCGAILWFISGMDRSQVIEWFRSGLLALCLALSIRWAIAEPYRIPSGSMETTLHGDPRFGRGDRVFVNKWVYGLRYPFLNKRIWYGKMPERWDIVVFKTVEEDALHKTLVKRVVGLPGEHIQIRNGKVYANGKALTPPASIDFDIYYTTPLDGPYGVQEAANYSNVPLGHYLLLGDNSAHSRDGRYFGWVPNEHIVGRVASIWWPPQRWRDFTGFSTSLLWRLFIGSVIVLVIMRLFLGRLCAEGRPGSGKSKTSHYIISFLSYGIYVPFVSRRVVQWKKPERGEMVLYKIKDDSSNAMVMLLGRVAGKSGETVSFRDGSLLINDQNISSPPFKGAKYDSSSTDFKYGKIKSKEFALVPEKCYFILSDNSNADDCPVDSRTLGWIQEENILGKGIFCWWPLKKFGRI